MEKDIKVMLGALGFTFLLIVGFSFWQGRKHEDQATTLSEALGVQINPENYDLGEVPINGGIVTKDYEVKNTTSQTIKLKKIVTSCMCTQVKASYKDRETRFFGMEHPGDRNPPINLEIPPGETAKVTVNFDPAAHGPQGVGVFDRAVLLTFSDPAGVKELTFNGTVVSK